MTPAAREVAAIERKLARAEQKARRGRNCDRERARYRKRYAHAAREDARQAIHRP